MSLYPQHREQKEAFVDDNCKLLLHMNGVSGNPQFIDSSNAPKVITAEVSSILSNSHYRFGGTSFYCDGSSNLVTTSSLTDFNFGTDNFTIMMWVYPTVSGGSRQPLIAYDGSLANMWQIFWDNSYVNCPAIYAKIGNVTVCEVVSSNALNINEWNQIVIVRNGTGTNCLHIYVNGVGGETTILDLGSSTMPNPTTNLRIGRGYAAFFTGYIDEVIIWKGIAKPIGELYPQARPYGYPIGGT